MSQLNVDNIRNRTGSNGGPNFPSGITVAVGQTAYIHGNLQVDGTETIINTETLNVSDKTVGIGSTSNASNTTADGAGIEIFASSSQTGNNKTLTWQNSSNAWTFGGGGIVATDAVVGSAVTSNASGIDVTGGIKASGIITASQKLDVRGDAIIGIDQVSGNPGTTVGITTIRGHHVNSDSQYAALYLANSESSGGSTASIRGERSGDNFGTNLSFYTNSTGSSGNGSERIRIGSSGQIGLGGANYGASGQVITSAGSGSAPTWSAIPAGGNEIDLVADGAVAAGKPVILTTAGKVKIVQAENANITNPSLKASTNIPSNLTGYHHTGIWHSTSGKGLIVYSRTTSGNSVRYRQFRTDSGGSITNVDTETNADGNAASGIKLIMDPDIDKPIMFWKRSSGDNQVYSRSVTIDGNGTNHAQASTAGSSSPRAIGMYDHKWDVCYDTNANIFVFVYKDSTDSGKGKVRLGYQSEPATGQHKITWINTDVEFSSDCESPRCEFDTVNNKVIIVWGQAGADVSACIGTVSGSGSSATISVGSRVVCNTTGAGSSGKPKMAWNTTDGVAGFLYRRSDNNQNALITLKTSGTTVHYTGLTQVGSENKDEMALWYVSSLGKFQWAVTGRIGWISSTGTPTSGGSGASDPTVGSGAIDISNQLFTGSIGDYEPVSGFDMLAHPLTTGYCTSNHGSDSGRLKLCILTIGGSVSNAASNHERLIGFAEDAISDGATGTIKLHGNVVGNQSGLTVASQYYIQADGTIGTSADNTVGGIKAGTAISATKLLISDPRI